MAIFLAGCERKEIDRPPRLGNYYHEIFIKSRALLHEIVYLDANLNITISAYANFNYPHIIFIIMPLAA